MEKLEKWFIGLLVGFIPPVIGFLAGWWGSFLFVSDQKVMLAALGGIAAGLVIDGLFLKGWIAKAWSSRIWIWMFLFLFYAVCEFGFFMGVPVFNLVLALPAGFYVGRRLANSGVSDAQERRITRRTQVFTTLVLAGICAASAIIAWLDETTAANLEGMLKLGFEVTRPMIAALILVGGSGLLLANWWLTSKTVQLTLKLGTKPGSA